MWRDAESLLWFLSCLKSEIVFWRLCSSCLVVSNIQSQLWLMRVFIIHCCWVFWTVNSLLALSDAKNIKFRLSGMLSLLSLLFPVFSGVMLASRLAHYLKSGKESVILSIHSLCLTDCVCWWEKGRAGREKKREGWSIWCLDGGWDSGEIQMQEREGNQTKKKGKKA